MYLLHAIPLWPAGHLPLKGGEHSRRRPAQATNVMAGPLKCVISPREGEMAGRPEGGAKGLGLTRQGAKALGLAERSATGRCIAGHTA
jgi:hypothetical protein